MPDDRDDRQSRRIATPQGTRIQTEERMRGQHRDHGVNRQPLSRPEPSYDAIPEEAGWEKTPVHLSPLDQANFRAKRASNNSHRAREQSEIAIGKSTQLRLELKADVEKVSARVDSLDEKVSGKVDLLDSKVEELGKKVSAQDGKLDVLTTMLKDELDAKRETTRNVTNVNLAEQAASGAFKRDVLMKVVLAVLGVLAALQVYFLTTQ